MNTANGLGFNEVLNWNLPTDTTQTMKYTLVNSQGCVFDTAELRGTIRNCDKQAIHWAMGRGADYELMSRDGEGNERCLRMWVGRRCRRVSSPKWEWARVDGKHVFFNGDGLAVRAITHDCNGSEVSAAIYERCSPHEYANVNGRYSLEELYYGLSECKLMIS